MYSARSPLPPASPAPSVAPNPARPRTRSLSRLTAATFAHIFPVHAPPRGDSTYLVVFLTALFDRAPTQPTTVFLALKYLAACAVSGHPGMARYMRTRTISVDPLLLLTAAIALADEYVNDKPRTLDDYARATGLASAALADARRAIGDALDWEFAVPADIFGQFVRWLREVAVASSGLREDGRRRVFGGPGRMDRTGSRWLRLTVKRALVARMTLERQRDGFVMA